MSEASETTALVEPTPSVSSASPTITEKEKSDNSGMTTQLNAEKKPAWSRLSNGGDYGIKPVMGASMWPSLSETTKASPSSSKLSSDWLTSLEDESLSSSSSVPSSQGSDRIDGLRLMEKILDSSFVLTSGNVAQGQSSSGHAEFTRGQNQRNGFESHSLGGNRNQYQRSQQHNQIGNHHPHQSQGGRRNHEHVNHNSSFHRNFSGRGRFAQAATSPFVRPPPPPPDVRLYAQYLPVYHQPFYLFGGPMHYPEVAPPMMYYPHRIPFMEPPHVLSASPGNRVQEAPLKTRIVNQVNYYLSEENLLQDEFFRKRMNDEGFVHIQLVAGFNKLKKLTTNIQLILDSLQGSYFVEGYEIRNRHVWRKFILPQNLRIPFYPSPEYKVASELQNMTLEHKPD